MSKKQKIDDYWERLLARLMIMTGRSEEEILNTRVELLDAMIETLQEINGGK